MFSVLLLVPLSRDPSATILPSTMRASVAEAAAPPLNFSTVSLHTDSPVPSPSGFGTVLLEVHASSVNPVDWKIVEEGSGLPLKFPHTLGFDVSGRVVDMGPGCTKRLKIGDEVWADLGKIWPLRGGELGAYAEYALADEAQVGLKPPTLSHVEAASLPLVALTSLQALRKTQPWPVPGSGQNLSVVVTSGAGGTGFVGIQLARALGASDVVTAVGSEEHAQFVRSLGATRVVNYKTQSLWDFLGKDSVDVVFDNFGAPNTADAAMAAIRTGGKFIFLPGKGGALSKHPKPGVTQLNFGYTDSSSHADLDDLSSFVTSGQLKAHVDQSFELAQVIEAFNASVAGHVMGKIGITVRDSARSGSDVFASA